VNAFQSRRHAAAGYIIAFFIPFCLFSIASALLDMMPFGENMLLFSDSYGQYLDFCAYLKSVFSGENNLLYSLSIGLGSNMFSLASYYLFSPFNLLFAFSSHQNLPLVYMLITALKISLCGLTFFYASCKISGFKKTNLAFSTAYALMSYNVVFQWSIIWLDGVYLLPLIGYGLYKLFQGESAFLYAFVIFLGLVSNYYIGYMLCGASLLLFLTFLISEWKFLTGRVKKIVGRYVLHSLIGGLSAAFVWLPAFQAQAGERLALTGFSFTTNFSPLDFAAKFANSATHWDETFNGMPHVFCGTLALLLTSAFLLNQNVALRKRLTGLGLLLVLFASFLISPLNVAWHGFSYNNFFHYRYSFIFSYVMLLIAQYNLAHLENKAKSSKPSKYMYISLLALFVAAWLVTGFVRRRDIVSLKGFAVSIASLVCFLICFVASLRRKQVVSWMLIAVTALEMGFNCYFSIFRQMEQCVVPQYPAYRTFVDKTLPAVEQVRAQDDGIYRMEKTFHRSRNDGMLFAYPGISHFSSSMHSGTGNFIRKMGMQNHFTFWTYYNQGSTAEAESLLGVKYVLSKSDLPAKKGYVHIGSINDVSIYQNPNALPIAMLVGENTDHVLMQNADYFALHNEIWSALTGNEEPILRQAYHQIEPHGLKSTPNSDHTISYHRIDPANPGSIRYTVSITEEKPLYFYLPAPEYLYQFVTIWVNGENRSPYLDASWWNMLYIGTYQPGDTVVVELIPDYPQDLVLAQPLFCYEDCDVLSQYSDLIKSHPLTLERQSSSHFSGRFSSVENQQILFTIPYDEGWQLYIDGERTPYKKVLDVFMAANVSEGEHSFELKYVLKGLSTGIAISCSALLLAFLLGIHKYKQRKAVA